MPQVTPREEITSQTPCRSPTGQQGKSLERGAKLETGSKGCFFSLVKSELFLSRRSMQCLEAILQGGVCQSQDQRTIQDLNQADKCFRNKTTWMLEKWVVLGTFSQRWTLSEGTNQGCACSRDAMFKGAWQVENQGSAWACKSGHSLLVAASGRSCREVLSSKIAFSAPN